MSQNDPLSAPRFVLSATGQARGVLLVHGFSGSPYELHLLADRLVDAGYSVALPMLRGHHQSLRTLAESTWQDWLSSAEQALLGLHRRMWETTQKTPQLAVIGFSMGGLLSLELARRYPAAPTFARPDLPMVRALSVLSSPLWLAPWQEKAIVRLADSGLRGLAVPKLAGRDVRAKDLAKAPLRPWGMPVRALASLVQLMRTVRPRLPDVLQPALLAHGQLDHTVPVACVDALADELGTLAEHKHKLVLSRSYHIVPLDVDREELFAAIDAHLARYLD